MIIIQDTREQTPWAFPEWVTVKIGTLKTGDYAIEGDENNFAIERKELNDYLGSISTGWDRFQREMQRARMFCARIIIVEGKFSECCYIEQSGEIIPPQHDHYTLQPQFIIKRTAELLLRGVCVLFAENAYLASAAAYAIFKERNNAIKSNN